MDNIIIIGSSGHAKVVCDIIEKEGKYKISGLIDPFRQKGEETLEYKVLGKEEDLPELIKEHNLIGGIIAIGDNYNRFKVANKINELVTDFHFITAIHPNAIISNNVEIGEGTVIMGGVCVNSCCKIGKFCILNTNSSLDHDAIMSDFSSIAPGVSIGGYFKLGSFSAICIGASIIQHITVGMHTIVGAGSVVLNDIGDYKLAYGIPAHEIRGRNEGEKYL
ncbi:MAG: transferase [Herbinix sp.]|jgi:sugar O-acyltransferase (sialic acid O-acetyltransferase NeuD family)|nr:transferase [Herbinix sp.]